MMISQGFILFVAVSLLIVLIGFIRRPIFFVSDEVKRLHPVDQSKACVLYAQADAMVYAILLTLASVVAVYKDGGRSSGFYDIVFFAGVFMWVYLLTFVGALVASRRKLSKLKGGWNEN